jgi:hypothetical protein
MEAVTLVLTTDYEFGAMEEAGRTEQCKGDRQFEERVCRRYVKHKATMCGGHLMLQLDTGAWPSIGEQHAPFDALFWGVGRHPVNGNRTTRHGTHNATAVVQERIQPLCSEASLRRWINGSDIGRQRVFWINSHARLRLGWYDERPRVIAAYNEGMSSALSEYCGSCSAAV